MHFAALGDRLLRERASKIGEPIRMHGMLGPYFALNSTAF